MSEKYRAKHILCLIDWNNDLYLMDDKNGTVIPGFEIEVWDEEDVAAAIQFGWDEDVIKWALFHHQN